MIDNDTVHDNQNDIRVSDALVVDEDNNAALDGEGNNGDDTTAWRLCTRGIEHPALRAPSISYYFWQPLYACHSNDDQEVMSMATLM